MIARRLRILACAVVLAATSSCALQPRPALPSAPPASLGLSAAGLSRIGPALQAFVDSAKVGGIYAVIARHGRIGYERTFGYRDVETRDPLRRDDVFRIYSMTKPVVAVGVLRLLEEGKLSLDDPVARFIPAFAHVKVFAGGSAAAPLLKDPESPVTVRQLLTHTSGLAYGLTAGPVDTIFLGAKLYDPARTLQQFADSVARLPLMFSPGTGWNYSSGIDIAARVIEVASGEPLDRFLQAEVFRPLGMTHTSFRWTPGLRAQAVTLYHYGADGRLEPSRGTGGLQGMYEPDARFLWGSGGLLSTPDDYLRFVQMLLNGGSFGGVRILRPETVALMTHNELPPALTPVSGGPLSDEGYGFGLAVSVLVDSARAHRPGPNGIFRWSGYVGTYFWVDPRNDMVAMVWTQLSPGSAVPLEDAFQRLVYGALQPERAGTAAGAAH